MRRRIAMVLAGVFVATVGSIGSAQAQEYFSRPVGPPYCTEKDQRARVLLLGSYHMANPRADAFNVEADDVLLPQRQKEIAEVVERLSDFRPTHVAVEAPWGDSATFARWREFSSGDGEARRSEEEQIGFRLARRMGLETIYPIDYLVGLDFGSVGRVIEQDPSLGRRMAQMEAMGAEAVSLLGAWLREGTIGHMLHRMNEPDNLARAHWPYVELVLAMVADEDYAGPEVVTTWYGRNLRIFSNVIRTASSPGDRVFVVFGQGHIPILRQLVIDHPGYCLEDPLPYLEGL